MGGGGEREGGAAVVLKRSQCDGSFHPTKGEGGSGGGCGEGRSEDMEKQVLHVVVVVIVAPYCVGDAQNYVHFLAHNSCEMRKLCRRLGLTYVRTRCASMKSLWEKDTELPP